MLAEVYGRVGQTDQAVAMIDEMLARTEPSVASFDDPELYRVKGEALLSRGTPAFAGAEARFRRAIEICARPVGEVVGAACHSKPPTITARYGPSQRSAPDAGRPEGGQGALLDELSRPSG
jgi:hypothetical protein